MDNFVIAIARGFGSGGKVIRVKTAEKPGVPCHEKQLLDMALKKDCIATVMDRQQVPESKAKELIHKTHKYRADYYKYYTKGKKRENSLNYDLMLNGSKVCPNNCMKLIKEYLNKMTQSLSELWRATAKAHYTENPLRQSLSRDLV